MQTLRVVLAVVLPSARSWPYSPAGGSVMALRVALMVRGTAGFTWQGRRRELGYPNKLITGALTLGYPNKGSNSISRVYTARAGGRTPREAQKGAEGRQAQHHKRNSILASQVPYHNLREGRQAQHHGVQDVPSGTKP